jgi:hypothetical protein
MALAMKLPLAELGLCLLALEVAFIPVRAMMHSLLLSENGPCLPFLTCPVVFPLSVLGLESLDLLFALHSAYCHPGSLAVTQVSLNETLAWVCCYKTEQAEFKFIGSKCLGNPTFPTWVPQLSALFFLLGYLTGLTVVMTAAQI